jgi:hypothetical protein
MLDIKVTHGSYWYGAQLPYWIYIALTVIPFTGFFGIDHLALRSPLTALLKGVLNIPLLGYWYFYDIAQAIGERDRLEKYGIGVPFFGPTGIGAGIFSGNKKIPEAPKQVPRPWTYMIYVLTTCLFIALPINKLVVGDYWGALAQVIMYLCFFTIITPILAVAWGLYDIYRVGFDTKGLFDKGPARFLPASWIISPYFKRDVLGPYPPNQISPSSWLGRVIEAWWEVPIQTGKAVSNTIAEAGRETTAAVAQVGKETDQLIKETGNTAENIVTSPTSGQLVNETLGLSRAAANEVLHAVTEAGDAAVTRIDNSVKPIGQAISQTTNKLENVATKALNTVGQLSDNTQRAANATLGAIPAVTASYVKDAQQVGSTIARNTTEAVNSTIGAIPAVTASYVKDAQDVGSTIATAAEQSAKAAADAAKVAANATAHSVQGTAQALANNAQNIAATTTQAVEGVATNTVRSSGDVLKQGVQGAEGLATLGAKLPELGQQVANQLPATIAQNATLARQAGGAILAATASSSDPSFTVIIVLFSLGFVAMSGYLFYTLRNLDKQKLEKSDDPPGESRAVRESSQSSK